MKGRKLIYSDCWGIVRHPNYLGDIITSLTICMPLIWRFALPPLLIAVWTIVILIHRTSRANQRNLLRYGSSWVQYCKKVPYKLIPGVY